MNENGAEAMLDTSATHNFVDELIVQQLGLKVSKCLSKIKSINSKAKPVSGIAFGVKFKVGDSNTFSFAIVAIPLGIVCLIPMSLVS